MAEYVLSLDQGTTSSRAIIFDKQGNTFAKGQLEYPQIYPKAGWVEHDPMDILYSQLNAVTQVIKRAKRIEGFDAKDIKAIGITNQRETTVVWDKETGMPIHNAIVWQCRRTADICEELKAKGLEPYVREHTGLIIDAYFSGTKIKWILDHVPGSRERAKEGKLLFGTVETWIIWKLTGGKAHVTDYSNASRTMLFDIDKLDWDPFLCEQLDIPMEMLPKPVPSSMVYGEVAPNILGLEELAGVPVAGAIGDQPGALFGQGCFQPGMAKNTYGTGCFLLMNTGEKRVNSKNNLLTNVAWGIGDKVTYSLEGSAFIAGAVIKWLQESLHLVDNPKQCDEFAETVEDSNGLYLVPAFTGLGAPYWDMYARGVMVGITRGVTREHVCRAALESICFQMTDLLEAMTDDSGIELQSLRVDGGASVSDIMMQIQANFIGCEVNRPKNVETTALGAAYMAGLAVGFWKDTDEIESNREVDKVFNRLMPVEDRDKLYHGWKRAVERSFKWIEAEE